MRRMIRVLASAPLVAVPLNLCQGLDTQARQEQQASSDELRRWADSVVAVAAQEVARGARPPISSARATELLTALLATSPLTDTGEAGLSGTPPPVSPEGGLPPPPPEQPSIRLPGQQGEPRAPAATGVAEAAPPPGWQPVVVPDPSRLPVRLEEMTLPPPPDNAGAAGDPSSPDTAEEVPFERPPGYVDDLPVPDPEEAAEIRSLIAQLKRPEAVERTQAAMDLALYGAAAAEAVPALVVALQDREAAVRVSVVRAIRGIGFVGKVPETAPGLLQALGDPTAIVRAEAALALSEIGPLGRYESQAIAALQTLLADADARVREAAAEALSYLGY